MNIAIIYAGGSGRRMQSGDIPKQFLDVEGKPIMVHTMEIFQNHPDIDAIVAVCIEGWTGHLKNLIDEYKLDKVKSIVSGGETGQLSIFQGLKEAVSLFGEEGNIVLLHDGVRPVLDAEVITKNIESVKRHGSAITCAKPVETVVLVNGNGKVDSVVERARSLIAKAPQSFWLKDIYQGQLEAQRQGRNNEIDSCTLMSHLGAEMHYIFGNDTNIKVTTPLDYEVLKTLFKSGKETGA